MDDTRAKEFIKKVFESEFSKESFTLFIRNLLNTFDESKAFHALEDVKEIFRPQIKTYERLGAYTDPTNNKIDILIIYLQKETSVERARSMQRNFVADYLKGEGNKNAALVAFVSPNPSDWRFSFVKMEYEMKIAENGKVKVSNTFTPVKRYSFLVGPHEASHTAQSRMLPHLKNSFTHPTLAELEELFSVEKVTNEFFDEYKELFADLVDSFSHNDEFVKSVVSKYGIDVADFSKKLMGQIVFLYFLQKKGWLGVKESAKWGTGDKYFMTNLYKSVYGSYTNFFNDILEPLFYDTLNRRDRGNGSVMGDQSWSPRFRCKIPYLNGGLFTPAYEWEKTNIKIENKIFEKIFATFDRYNFTVYEPDPIEKEVAVDPEMLGKVFERLLDVKDRKGKGAFYTPREIVQYMCRESLITYLKNNSDIQEDRIRSFFERKDHELGETEAKRVQILADESLRNRAITMYELLKNVKVCDPAVGSGAFPMGLLKEISSARHYLNNFFIHEKNEKGNDLTEYDIKKQTLENCIYGVDIEPGAVEIARLRFWLALIVEHDIEDVEPLPNLDYKIMQGNSLLEDLVVGGSSIKLNLSKLIKTDGRTKEMKNLFEEDEQGKLFLDQTDNIIQTLRQYHAEYFRQSDPEKKKVLKNKIDAKEDELIRSGCEEKIHDIEALLITETSQKKRDLLTQQILNIKQLLSKWQVDHIRPFFPWKLHFGEVFEKGGFDIVIGNPPYVNIVRLPSKEREVLQRQYSITKNKVDLYAFFIERADYLLQNNGVLSFIIPQTWKATDSFSKLRKFIFTKYTVREIVNLELGVFTAIVRPLIIVIQKKFTDNHQIIVRNSSFEAISTIDINDILNSVDYSIDTESNIESRSLFKRIEAQATPLGEILRFTRGIKTSNDSRFISKEKLTVDHKKVYRGKNIKPYFIKWAGEYIWYRPDLMREKVGCLPHTTDLFEVPAKLITQRINSSMRLQVAIDFESNYFLDTTNVSRYSTLNNKYSILYILGLLNSKLINFWYSNNYRMPTIGLYELHSIPIKQTDEAQNMIVDLVNNILHRGNDENNSELKSKIDQVVYKLYSLTENEIRIIEAEQQH